MFFFFFSSTLRKINNKRLKLGQNRRETLREQFSKSSIYVINFLVRIENQYCFEKNKKIYEEKRNEISSISNNTFKLTRKVLKFTFSLCLLFFQALHLIIRGWHDNVSTVICKTVNDIFKTKIYIILS